MTIDKKSAILGFNNILPGILLIIPDKNTAEAVPNVQYISEQKRFKNLETKQSVYNPRDLKK